MAKIPDLEHEANAHFIGQDREVHSGNSTLPEGGSSSASTKAEVLCSSPEESDTDEGPWLSLAREVSIEVSGVSPCSVK